VSVSVSVYVCLFACVPMCLSRFVHTHECMFVLEYLAMQHVRACACACAYVFLRGNRHICVHV